jgi:hypothetical protein
LALSAGIKVSNRAHLDGAGQLELLAQHAREIDIEALRIAVGPA